MAEIVTIHAAKTNLSRLVARAEAGEEIVIARGNKPVAKLVPIGPKPNVGSARCVASSAIAREGFSELAMTAMHGRNAGVLPMLHQDPFDRMLIAQALAERLVLVSNELIFDAYGVPRLW